MVSRAFTVPQAAGKRLYVFGPEAMTMKEALEVYGRARTPPVPVSSVPLWLVDFVARVTRNPEARFVADLFRFFSMTGERGDPREADELLGGPTTTLGQWLDGTARKPGRA